MWDRRAAQCGQVHALQRAHRRGDRGGELSLLHHRAECRDRSGPRLRVCSASPTSSSRRRSCPPRWSSWTSPVWLPVRPRVRAGQQVSGQHPRGACHRARGAVLRGSTMSPRLGRGEPKGRHRCHQYRAAARGLGDHRARARQGIAHGQEREQGSGRSSTLVSRCAEQLGAGRPCAHGALTPRSAAVSRAAPADRQAGAVYRQRRRGRPR